MQIHEYMRILPCLLPYSDVSEMVGMKGAEEYEEEGEPTTKQHRAEGEKNMETEMADLEGEDRDNEEEDQEGSEVRQGKTEKGRGRGRGRGSGRHCRGREKPIDPK